MDSINMDSICDNMNLSYVEYNGQEKALRKLAIEHLGAEKVAMMSNDDVCDYFRKDLRYVPLCVHTNEGSDIETIYLIKEENLNSAYGVIVLSR